MMMLLLLFPLRRRLRTARTDTNHRGNRKTCQFAARQKFVSRSRRPKSSTSSCCAKTRSYISLIRRSVSAALGLASRGKIETRFPARVAHPRRVLEGVAPGVQKPTRLGRGRYLACLCIRIRFPRRSTYEGKNTLIDLAPCLHEFVRVPTVFPLFIVLLELLPPFDVKH